MRILLLSAAFAALSLPMLAQQSTAHSSDGAGQAAASNFKKLSRSEVDDLLAKPGQVVFLDVRRPDEVSTIGGFPVYLSIQLSDLQNQLANIPRDKQIVTVSNHAGRAGKAANLLTSNGFQVVGVVGAQNYESEGGHLVKLAAPHAAVAAAAPAPIATAQK